MKKALLALAVVAFVVAGAAQPAFAQQQAQNNNSDFEEPEDNETETNETDDDTDEEMNETEEQESNETDRSQGKSAQFDARLQVAINTIDTLVEIAPNDDARNGLQNALDTLREVQNNTDTASLGPQDRPDEAENSTEENETGQEPQRGPPADRGPAQNDNRPGFVNQMLSSIFG